jgi:hypothetical protein
MQRGITRMWEGGPRGQRPLGIGTTKEGATEKGKNKGQG